MLIGRDITLNNVKRISLGLFCLSSKVSAGNKLVNAAVKFIREPIQSCGITHKLYRQLEEF